MALKREISFNATFENVLMRRSDMPNIFNLAKCIALRSSCFWTMICTFVDSRLTYRIDKFSTVEGIRIARD